MVKLCLMVLLHICCCVGWERMVLQILFLGPSNLLEPNATFEQMSQKLIVSPIVKTLVFSKVPEKVILLSGERGSLAWQGRPSRSSHHVPIRWGPHGFHLTDPIRRSWLAKQGFRVHFWCIISFWVNYINLPWGLLKFHLAPLFVSNITFSSPDMLIHITIISHAVYFFQIS